MSPEGSLVGEARLLSDFLQKEEFSFGRYGDTLGGRSEERPGRQGGIQAMLLQLENVIQNVDLESNVVQC
jgi:hypothetical protein